MFHLNHCARLAIIALVTGSSLFVAIDGKSEADAQKRIDIRAVWKPSRESIGALKEAMLNGKGTQPSLLAVMKNDHASGESLMFAGSYLGEAAYLSAIAPPALGGFTVGEVSYPFRSSGSRTFVILNARPRIIGVSDPKFLNRIDIVSSKDFRTLGISPLSAQCLWREPQRYDIQPGVEDHTDVEVIFPIKDLTKFDIVGRAHVVFEFSYPGRKLLGTSLDFIETRGE